MLVSKLWARSLVRIKASASGAENPGFKSQRARYVHSELGYLKVFQSVGMMSVGVFSLLLDIVGLLWRWRTLEKLA